MRVRSFGMQTEPDVAPVGVDVWVAAVAACAGRGQLDDVERGRLREIVGAQARDELAAGRALVRAVLSARFGAPSGGWRFATTATGRPFVDAAARPAFDFNLTHAGGLVCCALVDGPRRVGVDLERCDRALDVDAVAAAALSADERAGMSACAPAARRVRLLRLLTLKEAYLKAIGCGLTVRPASVELDLDGDRARLRGPEGGRWAFATIARGGFVLAVAAELPTSTMALRLHPGSALCRTFDQPLAPARSAA